MIYPPQNFKRKKSLDQKAILPTDKSLFDILSTKMKSVGF